MVIINQILGHEESKCETYLYAPVLFKQNVIKFEITKL